MNIEIATEGTRIVEAEAIFGSVAVERGRAFAIPVADIIIGARHRQDFGDLSGLVESIDQLGLLHPIVVDANHKLVSGERRLAAVKKLSWKTVPVTVVTKLSDALLAMQAERDENVERKDFTPEENVAMGDSLLEIEKPHADQRKQEGLKKGGKTAGRGRTKQLSDNLSESKKHTNETNVRVAKGLGMSRVTYEKAKEIVEEAKKDPAMRPLVDEMNRTGRVSGVHRKLKTKRQAKKIQAEPAATPEGPFRVIVADPPWSYDKRGDDPSHRGANPYPSMDIPAICGYQAGDKAVSDLAHKDCILWLWTTNAHLHEAFTVMESWGFEYKTLLTWVKNKMGTGDWLRGKTEHCLLGIRGKPTIVLKNETTALLANAGKHSAKPEEFYQLVERMCPGSKLELFSRRKREGWIAHGAEV